MYRIFCIMGKSSSGKDTLYRELLRDPALQLQKVVMYTTRPPRDKEVDGREYYFTSEPMFHAMCKAGKVIEHRVYETVQGPWYYYTADDGQIDLGRHNYLIIGTLDVYTALRDHFGPAHVVPILMEVDDGERLSRALRRERRQKHPQYEEMCRRFLADQQDFSEEKIRAAGIRRRFSNASIGICKEEVRRFIAGTEKPAEEKRQQGKNGQGRARSWQKQPAGGALDKGSTDKVHPDKVHSDKARRENVRSDKGRLYKGHPYKGHPDTAHSDKVHSDKKHPGKVHQDKGQTDKTQLNRPAAHRKNYRNRRNKKGETNG